MEASGPESVETASSRAVEALGSELRVVFGDAGRVERACDALRRAVAAGAPWPSHGVASLIDLALARSSPANRTFLRFLLDWMPSAVQPWDILRRLITSADPDIERAACERVIALIATRNLELSDNVIEGVAIASSRPSSPFCDPEMSRAFRTALHVDEVLLSDAVPRFLIPRADGVVARFAARLLDETGRPPDSLVEELLGSSDWNAIRSCWHYTQGRYTDLVALLCGQSHEIATALTDLRETCPAVDAGECIAVLGWPRCNLALRFVRLTGLAANGSIPFMFRDAESSLLARCEGVRLAYERTVVIAVGAVGNVQTEEPGDAATREVSGGDAVARFRAHNLLHAQILGQLLDLAPLTAETVEGMLGTMARIVADFTVLFASWTGECGELHAVYAQLEDSIRRALADSAPGRPLSASVTRLVQMFEDPKVLSDVRTLHGLKRYLHQRGLALGFRLLEGQGRTNRSVDFVVVDNGQVLPAVRRIEYVDFEPLEPAARPLPDGVTLLVDELVRLLASEPTTRLPSVKVFCYGNEVHYYLLFGNHPVFVRIDLSPPLAGGMVDLEYYGVSKYELDGHPDLDLRAIRAFFERLEFDVQFTQTRIHARYDKERAVSLGDICDKARALFRLMPYLMDLDWLIGKLDLSAGARTLLIDAWSDVFAKWGILPVHDMLSADGAAVVCGREPEFERDSERFWDGSAPYRDVFSGTPGSQMANNLWRTCRERGLPIDIEHHDVTTQLSLERHLLEPLREAMTRGEVVVGEDGLHPAPRTHFRRCSEAVAFADLLQGPDDVLVRAGRMATRVSAIERNLHFEAAGSVDGFSVQRAWLSLRLGGLMLFVLRDGAEVARVAFFCRDRTLAERRSHESLPWQSNQCVDVEWFARHLRQNNFLPAWLDGAPEAFETAEGLRERFARPVAEEPEDEQEYVIRGATVAPGRVTGLACIGTTGREPGDVAGRVLITPTLGPDDTAFLFQSAGLVCTGGAGLSHAGLLANQFGRPGLIVTGVIDSGGAARHLSFTRLEWTESRTQAFGRRIVDRRITRTRVGLIADGDLVELDADARLLCALGQHRQTLRFHAAWRQLLEAHRQRVQARDDSQVLIWRGVALRARRHLEQLCTELREERLARFIVRELVSASVREGSESEATNEADALLAVLIANPSVADTVTAHLSQRVHSMDQRLAMVEADALSGMPSTDQPDEILAHRLAVRRSFDALGAALVFAPSMSLEVARYAARIQEIERIAMAALRRRWDQAILEGQTTDQSERHVIGQLRRLQTILPVSPEVVRRVDEQAERLRAADAASLSALRARSVLGERDGGIELVPLVGSKAANLAEVVRGGMASLVPPWFVVSDTALRAVLEWIGRDVDGVLATTSSDAHKASEIRALWEATTLPAELEDDIAEAYRRLCGPSRDGCYVAVRSSACEEDTEIATRAGEFDTFLFVRGADAVVDHVKRVWAGFWSARAIHSRRIYGTTSSQSGGGVLVQRMVVARVSGVLQTIDLPRARYREMVIDVGLGLGEGVVSGQVGTDRIVVEKNSIDEEVLRFRYLPGDKRQRLVFAEGPPAGLLLENTAAHQRLRTALEYIELHELVRAARKLERWYHYPLDIEFAFDGSDLRIVQVRPVPGMLNVWWATRDRYPFKGRPDAGSTM